MSRGRRRQKALAAVREAKCEGWRGMLRVSADMNA